ncbi:hypothetical protein MRX96_043585 [Rhipicephalus microplus]
MSRPTERRPTMQLRWTSWADLPARSSSLELARNRYNDLDRWWSAQHGTHMSLLRAVVSCKSGDGIAVVISGQDKRRPGDLSPTQRRLVVSECVAKAPTASPLLARCMARGGQPELPRCVRRCMLAVLLFLVPHRRRIVGVVERSAKKQSCRRRQSISSAC